jgi:type IV fimbrial biogenesis protein FimT
MLVMQSTSRRRVGGFTLIEMITTITVAGILATIAIPSFSQFVANQRIRNVSFDLMAALTLARSEAVTRGIPVSLTKTSATWDQGWTVTDGTNTIQAYQAYKNLSITDSASLAAVSYGKDGRTVTPNTRITVAPATATNGVTSRCINISLSGLPSSSVGAC